ncbi:hypothetical protein [Pedobacter sp. V48]|uniref:hypothetical protein n=1 Tax=Pedobacter sp. V48 TaxID=509635 RepID=UPI0003E4580F|nr:hypothetical protein [Pedobacter sp. V48]ETZ23025.1 hypothetical protein N824_20530 [Pedobacter sp. V48]
MQHIQPKKLREIWHDTKTHISKRLEYFRLKTVEKTAKIMGDLLSGLLLIFILSLAFIAVTISLSFYLSELLGSYPLGFGCAAVFLLTGSLLMMWKKERLEHWIGGISVKKYFERHYNEKEDGKQRNIESSSREGQ